MKTYDPKQTLESGLNALGEMEACLDGQWLNVDEVRAAIAAHATAFGLKVFTWSELKAINDAASDLCKGIEALPASPEATALSMKASNVLHPINRKLYPHP